MRVVSLPSVCFASQLVALAIEGVQNGALLSPTGLSAGQAYTEMADLAASRSPHRHPDVSTP
jgi:hypothetical protein